MGKSFEDYDKITIGDRFAEKSKVFGLGFLGGVVGCLPYVILLTFGISSQIMYLISGACAMTFYAAFGKFDGRKFIDHVILVLTAILTSFLSQCFVYVTHYAAMWEIEGREMNNVQKLFYAIRHAHVDRIEGVKIVLEDGMFSLYSMFIIAEIISIIGLYIAFIFVAISRDGKKK